MKSKQLFTRLAATTAAIATLVITLHGCSGPTSGDLTTLDLAAAIDNPRPFDLTEIADDIELIPLDDTQRESLLGNISQIAASRERFYVLDNSGDRPVKVFDRQGRFIGTRGQLGRGPNEFLTARSMAVDPDTDELWLSVFSGGRHAPLIALDAAGRVTNRNDSISRGNDIVLFDGKIVSLISSPSNEPQPDSLRAIVDVYSSTSLRHETSVSMADNGDGVAIVITTTDGMAAKPDYSNVASISVGVISPPVIAGNGRRLLVKDERGDTLFNYRGGALEAAYRLDHGRYKYPDGAFGMSPTWSGDGFAVGQIYEGDRYIVVKGAFGSVTSFLVFDRRDPAAGFSAHRGADDTPGLFLDGLPFTPSFIRDNRLVGYLSALDVTDAADRLTHPALKAAAQNIREDSNPILVVAKLTD